MKVGTLIELPAKLGIGIVVLEDQTKFVVEFDFDTDAILWKVDKKNEN